MAFSFHIPFHSRKFQSHSDSYASQTCVSIPINLPVDIPIPSHSHYRLPNINDCVEELMEIVTTLSFTSHTTIVSATGIYVTISTQYTIVLQQTDRNQSYYGPLCESRKHKSTKCTVILLNLTNPRE